MGSPESEIGRLKDETQHSVTLNAFKMSKYAITFEQYDAYLDAKKETFKPGDEGWGRGKRPVINVNYFNAYHFAKYMGCRLPSEEEWEYACRAGTTTAFNTGNTIEKTQANFGNTSSYAVLVDVITKSLTNTQSTSNKTEENNVGGKTMPVGSYPPNGWGLYDMHGNVEEWTSTFWSRDIVVRRGGSWLHDAKSCRSAFSDANWDRGDRSNYFGIRLVSDI